ncbi:MAG: thiamine pyrophosphate-dependent enzyme [Solirubrobacteraceae bacterium]
MTPTRSGGRILIDQLVAHGTKLAFCVPGESYLAALDALYDTPSLRLVVCRMEAGAANMACAHGQLTGAPGICFVTRGPGAAHAAVGVHTARQGSVPMLLLVGQVPRSHRGREAFQEIDIEAMFAPLAKWVAYANAADQIPELVAQAFARACEGRPGPVVLALPEDVLAEESAVTDATPLPLTPARPSADAVVRARELVAAATRPLVVVGGGAWSRTAADGVRELCESWGVPVASAFRRQDHIDNDSAVYCGMLGLGMDPRLAARARDADVLLAIGTRLDEPTTGAYTIVSPPQPRQALIHVHADVAELGRVFEPALAIHGGADEFARAARALPGPDPTRWSEWTARARADAVGFRTPAEDDLNPGGERDGGIDLAGAISRLRDELGPEAIVANGAGNYALWVHRYWRYGAYGTELAPVSGAMGYGVPAAIAAKLAHPDRPVISFNGDGCFLMCGQELATAVQHGAAPVFVVVDNSSYGTIRSHQQRRHPGRPVGTELVNPDFVAYARAFGVQSTSVQRADELVAAVLDGVAADRPTLVHVPLSPERLTPPVPAPAPAASPAPRSPEPA